MKTIEEKIQDSHTLAGPFAYVEDVIPYIDDDKNATNLLNGFHVQKVFMVEKDDEYLAGIRANHFVIEEGWTEIKGYENKIVVITGNHKGSRMTTIVEI